MASKLHGPHKKYLIFVSSSLKDLGDERKAVIQQILKAGHIPAGMELFTASSDEDLTVIRRAVDQADVYVVLVGARFGTPVDEKTDRQSYTQMEFRYARDSPKPILSFLMDDDQFEEERNNIPAEDRETLFEGELRQFREEVKETVDGKGKRSVDYFGDKLGGVGGLAAKFHAALGDLIDKHKVDMSGWIPGSDAFTLPKEIDDNKFIRDMVEIFCTYDVLSARCVENPLLKETMASYFWDQYEAKITNLGIRRLFFESGSTVAFLSAEFKRRLSRPSGLEHMREWKIRTNNILTYLDFVLSVPVRIKLVPYGPPEEKYGATFGEINLLSEPPPPTKNEPLTGEEEDVVETMANVLRSDGEQVLLLAAASGIELSEDSGFRGPHIGSYYNKLFKRAILTTGKPVVLFVDESKVPAKFLVGKCHAVCGPGMDFEHVCRSVPLAFCVGCRSREGRERVLAELKPLGFDHVDPAREEKGCWPLVAKNRLFEEFIEQSALS